MLLRRIIYHFEKEERNFSPNPNPNPNEIFRVCNPNINDMVIQSPNRNTYCERFHAIPLISPKEYTVKKRNRYGMEQTRLIRVNWSKNVEISKPGGKNNRQDRDLQVTHIRDIKKGNNNIDNSFIATVIKDNEVYEQIFTCTSKSECSSIIECVKYAITK